MKDRPILFSAPMVRAILADTKTQTRRALKAQPVCDDRFAGGWKLTGKAGREASLVSPLIGELSPYGQTGDRLWVRETWACLDSHIRPGSRLTFRASTPDGERVRVDAPWRPSIHMPRWASRISLEITGVRVERLQSISEDDAQAEGCARNHNGYFWGGPHPESGLKQLATAGKAFRDLWQSINGPDSWDDNPWVWVVEFKRVDGRTPDGFPGGAA